MNSIASFATEVGLKSLYAGGAAALVAKYLSRKITYLHGANVRSAALLAASCAGVNTAAYALVDLFCERTGYLKNRHLSKTICGFTVSSALNTAIGANCYVNRSKIGLTHIQIIIFMNIASATIWSVKLPLLIYQYYKSQE